MSHLDDELRIALRREEPPEGFVNRVLERLPAEPPRATVARPGMTRMWLAAAAALVLATSAVLLVLPLAPRSDVGSLVPPKATVPTEPSTRPTSQPDTPVPVAPTPANPSTTAPPTPKRAPRLQPRRVRDDAEALHAAEQLRTALGVTSEKFRLTQREVSEALVVPES